MKRTKTVNAPAVDESTTRALAALRRPAEGLDEGLRAEVAAIVAGASKSAPKVVAATKACAKRLGDTAECAAVYDAVAAALYATGGRARPHAATCHAAARAIERKRKVKVDLDVATDIAAALAVGGGVWVKELAQLAKSARAAKRGDLGSRVARAAIDAVRGGEAPSDDLLAALAALDPSHAVTALAGWIVDADLTSLDDAAWAAAAPWMGAALDRSPGALARVTETVTGPRPAPGWVAALAAADCGARLAAATPERARSFAEHLVGAAGRMPEHAVAHAGLDALLPPLFAVMRARGESLDAVRPADACDARTRFHAPELTERLLMLDAPLSFAHADDAVFDLYGWGESTTDRPTHGLARVAAHPILGPRLAVSLERSMDLASLSNIVAKFAATPSLRDALDQFSRSLLGDLGARGTLGAFLVLREGLGRLCQPAVLAAAPRLGDRLQRLDAATMLQQQLRGGMMDEWGWPALDAAAERLGRGFDLGGSVFPHLALRKDDRVVVVGPDDVVLDRADPRLAKEFQWLRAAVFVDGDLLMIAGDYTVQWLVSGETVTTTLQHPALVDLLDRGGVMSLDGRPIRRGDTTIEPGLISWGAHYDGVALHVRQGNRWLRHEPVTARALPDGAPAWVTGRDGVGATSFMMAVPPGASRSPLGARDGLGGFVAWNTPFQPQRAEGIDGRAYDQHVGCGWYALDAVMTFPERDGFYPVVRAVGGSWVYLPDGRTALVAVDGPAAHTTWSAGPVRLGIPWWHLYTPRDVPGSRALARCTLEQAEALLRAAREATAAPHDDVAKELTGYPGLRVHVTKPHESIDALEAWPAVADAVCAALPEVTHPRVIAGVVRWSMLAVEVDAAIEDLARRVTAATSGTAQSGLTNARVARLERFFDADFTAPGRWGQDQLGQQVLDVAAFLFGDGALDGERPVVSTVPPCFVAWEHALVHGAEMLPWMLGAGTSAATRDALRAFFALWRATPFADDARVARCRLVGFTFASAPVRDLHHDRPARLVAWENRYFLRWRGNTVTPCSFVALEVTRDGTFRTPPGALLDWEEPIAHRLDAARIDQCLALLDARGPAPLDAAAVDALTESTGLLRDAAAVLLSGARLESLDRDGRAALGTTSAHLAFVGDELRVPALHTVVASSVPRDLTELYTPRSPGDDGESLVARLARAWNAAVGRRPALTVERVERMEEDLRNPHPPFLRAARALSSPESFACLTRAARWVHRPFHTFSEHALRFGSVPSGWPQHHDTSESDWVPRWPDAESAFSYEVLPNYLKYLSWAHLELPVGDPMREGAGRLAAHIAERLASPEFLLPVAFGALDDCESFARFIASRDARPYVACDGGPGAAGVETRGVVLVWPGADVPRDGVFVSLRTAALTVDDLCATLGVTRATSPTTLALPGARLDVVSYLPLFLLWRSDGFQSLVADLRAPSLPPGAFAADPRASAPDAVAAARARHDLDDDAATLWLQLRWLAEPTPSRVRRYNTWTRARYDDAAATLVARGLVEAVAHKGSARAHGIPGPWAFFERYPGAVERAKLDAYGLTEGAVPILDVPLPLCPVGALFARDAP